LTKLHGNGGEIFFGNQILHDICSTSIFHTYLSPWLCEAKMITAVFVNAVVTKLYTISAPHQFYTLVSLVMLICEAEMMLMSLLPLW
jgi:hypothetical protein